MDGLADRMDEKSLRWAAVCWVLLHAAAVVMQLPMTHP